MRRALATLLVLAAAGPARGNPIDQFGFGSRAAAMAGAAAADVADGAAANYYNPGALIARRRMTFELGYTYNHPDLSINGQSQGVDDSRGILAGLVVPGRIGKLELAVGAAVHLPDERITRTRQLLFSRPRWVLFDNRPQRLLMSTNLAVRIMKGLTIGGGITYMSREKGLIDLKGLVGLPDPKDSNLDLAIGVDLVSIRYPQAGILWEPAPGVAVGLTYRDKFELEVHEGFRVDGSIGAPGIPPIVENGYFQLLSQSTDLFQPAQVAAGLSLQPWRRTRVELDATWNHWSAFKDPAAVIALSLDLKQLNNLVRIPPPRTFGPAGFHDTIVPRLGIEHQLHEGRSMDVTLRGGYSYDPSPVPEQGGTTNFVDNDKHSLLIGAGLAIKGMGPILPRPLLVDVHLGATFLPERLTRKWSPVDPVGDYRSGGTLWQIGLTTRAEF